MSHEAESFSINAFAWRAIWSWVAEESRGWGLVKTPWAVQAWRNRFRPIWADCHQGTLWVCGHGNSVKPVVCEDLAIIETQRVRAPGKRGLLRGK